MGNNIHETSGNAKERNGTIVFEFSRSYDATMDFQRFRALHKWVVQFHSTAPASAICLGLSKRIDDADAAQQRAILEVLREQDIKTEVLGVSPYMSVEPR